jgi:hypothetical protein
MFDLYFEIDKEDQNNFFIKTREEFYKGSETFDVTEKLIINEEIENSLVITNYREFALQYKPTEDYHSDFFRTELNSGYEYGTLLVPTTNQYSPE